MLDIKKEKLIFHYDTEEVWIEPWGGECAPGSCHKRA